MAEDQEQAIGEIFPQHLAEVFRCFYGTLCRQTPAPIAEHRILIIMRVACPEEAECNKVEEV